MRSIFSLQQIWNLEIVHGLGAMGNFLMCVCLELDWVLKGRLTKKVFYSVRLTGWVPLLGMMIMLYPADPLCEWVFVNL